MLFLSSSSTTFHPRWSCSSCICFLLGMTGPRLLEVLEITPGTFSASRHGTRSFHCQSREEDTVAYVCSFFYFFFQKMCLLYIRGLVVGVWLLASFFPCMCCVCWHWSLQMPHLDTFHLSVCCWWCPWWSLWSSFCLQAGTLQFHILYTLTSSDLRFSNDLSISMFFSWHYDVSLKGFLRSAKIL